MRLTIIHHHYRPGGVTKVVTSGLQAILEHLEPGWKVIDSILLVAGEKEHLNAPLTELPRKGGESAGLAVPVKSLHVPQFHYIDDIPEPQRPTAAEIEGLLESRFAGDLLWVHNYHLGKNPAFTEGLVRFALNRPEQPVMLQIHDFPESGRPGNLERLYRETAGPLYPVAPNILYLVINPRDRGMLIAAGIPEASVMVMDNPVLLPEMSAGTPADAPLGAPAGAPVGRPSGAPLGTPAGASEGSPGAQGVAACSRMSREELDDALAQPWKGVVGRHRRGGANFIYPVRAIRRKNVLETALLTLLREEPSNLIVTLPGVSLQERDYSDAVAALYEEGLIPGKFGIGGVREPGAIGFEELAVSCDMVVSSSIQEGFGYFFVDALRWGRPLLARNLDMLSGLSPLWKDYPAGLYDQLLVPLREERRRELLGRYRKKLAGLSPFLQEHELDSLSGEIETLLRESLWDFSFLDDRTQIEVIQRSGERGFLRELRSLNSSLLEKMEGLLKARPEPPLKRIEESLGGGAFARRAFAAMQMVLGGDFPATGPRPEDAREVHPRPDLSLPGLSLPDHPRNDPVHRSVLLSFAAPAYLRLLFG